MHGSPLPLRCSYVATFAALLQPRSIVPSYYGVGAMGPLTVDVKWQKELLRDIEIDTEQPPLVFKSQLFTLTGKAPSFSATTDAVHHAAAHPHPPSPSETYQPSQYQFHVSAAEQTSAGVAPDRQKIMVKGGMLKDDADWSALGIKPGQKLMMMGSAGAARKPIFRLPIIRLRSA